MAGASALFTEQWTPTKSMKREALKSECDTWRALWGWIDEETKYYLTHIGELCRVIERNYHGVLGDYLQPKFELKSLEVGTYEKQFNQVDGRWYIEKKTARIPTQNIIKLEFIQERSLAEEVDSGAMDTVFEGVGSGSIE